MTHVSLVNNNGLISVFTPVLKKKNIEIIRINNSTRRPQKNANPIIPIDKNEEIYKILTKILS